LVIYYVVFYFFSGLPLTSFLVGSVYQLTLIPLGVIWDLNHEVMPFMITTALLVFLDGALWGWIYGKSKNWISTTHYLKRAIIILGLPIFSFPILLTVYGYAGPHSSEYSGVLSVAWAFSAICFGLSLFIMILLKSKLVRTQIKVGVFLAVLSLIIVNLLSSLAGFT